MSALTRFLAPASRRSFSYFSSKSGGGRYFNSAKSSSKTPPATPTTPKDAASGFNEIQAQDIAVNAAGDAQTASVSAASSSASTTAPSPASTSTTVIGEITAQALQHPTLSAKDVKLHQFFAMGRPQLLLSQPASILRPVPAGAPLFSILAHLDQQAQVHWHKNLEALGLGPGYDHARAVQVQAHAQGLSLDINAPVDPFIDADAEAARQLTRALTMNKAAATLSWEATMRRM